MEPSAVQGPTAEKRQSPPSEGDKPVLTPISGPMLTGEKIVVPPKKSEAIENAKRDVDPLDAALARYLDKPRFSKYGLEDFFKLFNTPLYAQFLPRCFINIVDFLEYATRTKKPASFVIKVLNIFDQRMKESRWVNGYALIALMDALLVHLPPFCAHQPSRDRMAEIRDELKKSYESHKKNLKKNLDKFFDEAAQAIEALHDPDAEELDILELQLRVGKFLEGAISRLIWNPHDQAEIWRNVADIAQRLQQLHATGLLASSDDFNILLWALIYRLNDFVDCAGSQLTGEFFLQMMHDLRTESIAAFAFGEQERFLLTKRQFLEDLALRGQAKVAAAASGLYVDGIL